METTYRAFCYLNSAEFLNVLGKITGIPNLITDIGLHGGGLHFHPPGGKLNVHKDYSIHPKLRKERRLNLIVYMTPDWNAEWGGDLQLWSHDAAANKPAKPMKQVPVMFNRAILFDTTQDSWHGLPDPLKTPPGINRQSMAVYYLTEPRKGIPTRDRALFTPTPAQAGDAGVLRLIEKRSSSDTSCEVYREGE